MKQETKANKKVVAAVVAAVQGTLEVKKDDDSNKDLEKMARRTKPLVVTYRSEEKEDEK